MIVCALRSQGREVHRSVTSCWKKKTRPNAHLLGLVHFYDDEQRSDAVNFFENKCGSLVDSAQANTGKVHNVFAKHLWNRQKSHTNCVLPLNYSI